MPEEKKEIGQQARLASKRKQQASLAAQPLVRWLSTEAWLAATETLTPAEARRGPTEARLAATESLAPAEMPKQPQECSQRTPQPQHLRDQPKGHSVRQQRELEEPSPSNMDWPRSQGEEDAMHNSRRAESQDETAAEVQPMPPTNAARGRRRTGQAAEVAEALIPSPTSEDPPTARNGRPTASGMSTGATASTADKEAARETDDEELPEPCGGPADAPSSGGCRGDRRRGASGAGEPCGGPADAPSRGGCQRDRRLGASGAGEPCGGQADAPSRGDWQGDWRRELSRTEDPVESEDWYGRRDEAANHRGRGGGGLPQERRQRQGGPRQLRGWRQAPGRDCWTTGRVGGFCQSGGRQRRRG
jgi:hypothetical protein